MNNIRIIQNSVCKKYNITREELIGRSRESHIYKARKEAMIQCRKKGYTYGMIGFYFNRHHSTVMHNCVSIKVTTVTLPKSKPVRMLKLTRKFIRKVNRG